MTFMAWELDHLYSCLSVTTHLMPHESPRGLMYHRTEQLQLLLEASCHSSDRTVCRAIPPAHIAEHLDCLNTTLNRTRHGQYVIFAKLSLSHLQN